MFCLRGVMEWICICAQSRYKLSVYDLAIHPSNKEEIWTDENINHLTSQPVTQEKKTYYVFKTKISSSKMYLNISKYKCFFKWEFYNHYKFDSVASAWMFCVTRDVTECPQYYKRVLACYTSVSCIHISSRSQLS